MGKPVADPWNVGSFNPGSELTMWLEHPLFYALEVARSLDDAAEMFIRQVQKMHNKASDALVIYRAAHAERTDALVARLREIALA